MVVFGIGLGMAMQLYTLVVQNAASARDMGWPPPRRSSSAASGRRSASPSLGTVMTSGLADAIRGHLPAAVLQQMAASGNGGGISAGSVLDPEKLKALPPVVADAVRQGLAEQLHEVFLLGPPILAVAFIARSSSARAAARDRARPRGPEAP